MAYVWLLLSLVWLAAGLSLTWVILRRGIGIAIVVSDTVTVEERHQRMQRLRLAYRAILITLQFGWVIPLFLAVRVFNRQ